MRQLEVVPTFAAQLGGKILAHAHAIGDVDGDDATELIFGSIAGDIAIYKIKGERFVKWRSCSVDGSVSAICVDTSVANDARVFVATAEGSCFVVTESGDEFRPSSEFRVALNVCDLAVLDGDLVVGTRDGGLYIYRADANALGGYKQLEKFELKREIASLRLLSGSNQLVVCCTSGECFHVATLSEQQPKKHTVQSWQAPRVTPDAASAADRVAYIVDSVRSGGGESQTAVASLGGQLTVVNASYETQWSVKLSEALVALDKLSLATLPETQDVLVACTWSGQLYAVASPDAVVYFRMLYPAATMFCADVYETSEQSERVLVAISTSGVIFVFRHLADTLARALARSPLSDAIRARADLFALMDTPAKRQALLMKHHAPEDAPSASPTVQDVVRLALRAASLS